MRDDLAGEEEADEKDLAPEFDEGFDRTDFKTEFSPSPNLEGPQPQPKDNTSANSPEVNSPPRARTNNDSEFDFCSIILHYCMLVKILLSIYLIALKLKMHG